MIRLLITFWHEEEGFVLSAELVLIATIVTLASVVGLAEVSLAVNRELFDVANAFRALNQSFSAQSTSPNGSSPPSQFQDSTKSNNMAELGGSAPTRES